MIGQNLELRHPVRIDRVPGLVVAADPIREFRSAAILGNLDGVVPILKATPPDDVRRTPAAAEHPGREEIVAWAVERPGGGRGFGFTGGHFHANWGDDYFRKLVLNALVWAAHGEVPSEGVASHVEPAALKQNLDPKGK